MSVPSIYDHVRPTDTADADGIYRVVGTGEAGVTLLRVANADGRRVHTGELRTVDTEALDGFEPAANPDGNRPLGAALASTLSLVYWSARSFGRELTARPLPAAVALLLLVAGSFGDRFVSAPDLAFGGLIIAGSLGLAYAGSGRL